MHGCGFTLPPLCINGLTQDVSEQPMYIQNPAGLQLADYKVQRLQYLQSLAAIQKQNRIRQQHYLQVACSDVWTVSVSRRPACMSLYLANDYLLMTEDVLSFVII